MLFHKLILPVWEIKPVTSQAQACFSHIYNAGNNERKYEDVKEITGKDNLIENCGLKWLFSEFKPIVRCQHYKVKVLLYSITLFLLKEL